MNFTECVKYIENARRESRDKVDLSVITELLDRLGNPQNSFKSIHVAGTNGKGSVCAYVESALRVQGYKTGLFTSPYIHVFNERIQISGKNVEDKVFTQAAIKVIETAEDMHESGYPSAAFFELLTSIAFVVFKQSGVDVAVVETGIGGTNDSTNVINPVLSIITAIGYDHMNILGNSIDEIADKKAGIIKKNTPVVISNQNYDEAYAVLLNVAKEKNAPLFSLKNASILIDSIGFDGAAFYFKYGAIEANIETHLVGFHQVHNAACAFLALCVIAQYTDVKLSGESILMGIKSAEWIGRMEVLNKNPLIILDGAHNEQAMKSLVKSIESFIPLGKINIVYGAMEKKNYILMAKHLKKISKQIYTVSFDDSKSVAAQQLAVELSEENVSAVHIGDLETTLKTLNEQNDAPILVCGSLYLAGKARDTVFTLKKH